MYTVTNWPNRDPINEFGFWPYRVKVLSDNDQLFLQQESNLYRYVDNDGIRLIDPLGLCPPSGCSYEPDVWNQPGVKENNNCYSYACNNMHGPPPLTNQPTPGGKPQPGGGGNPPFTCADITAAAKSDGLVDPDSNGCCPTGYHKVSLFIAPNVDYHWYREDSNGNWSHKPGNTDATNLDASGNPITDPSAADRDYSEAGGPNYNQDCGVLCSQS